MKKKKCLRCGHEWLPRLDTRPKACPSCKNRKWDEVRVTPIIKKEIYPEV
jgi:DNA-directed RNA polymerase subunit RPC12/RpoP